MERLTEFFKYPASKDRAHVVDAAVRVEWLISSFLSTVLGVKQVDSRSFGNKSSALSFNARVNLLLDIRVLDEANKNKLLAFAEIRNQFAHNYSIHDFNDLPEDSKNKLKKWYLIKNTEPDYKKLYNELFNEIQDCIEKVFERVVELAGKKGEALGAIQWQQLLKEEAKKYAEADPIFGEKLLSLYADILERYDSDPPDDIISRTPLL